MIAGPVVALYVQKRSIYRQLGVECFDIERDARSYGGWLPVVAHPPCRAWGRLRAFAKPRDDEAALAFHALLCVRECGGVLEHPAGSSFWTAAELPLPGAGFDRFGGWTLPVNQQDFGHRAPKATWLYVVGCLPKDVPAFGLRLGVAPGRIEAMGKAERERTPEAFARWLIELARRCGS